MSPRRSIRIQNQNKDETLSGLKKQKLASKIIKTTMEGMGGGEGSLLLNFVSISLLIRTLLWKT